MIISCSATGIVDLNHPKQGIGFIADAEFDNVLLDLGMGCSGHDFEEFGKAKEKSAGSLILDNSVRMTEVFEPFVKICRDNKLNISTVYAPHLLRDTKRTDLYDIFVRILEESIRLCGKIGCHHIVIRPFSFSSDGEEEWKRNREYYLRLSAVAREQKVLILLENQCRNVNGHLIRGNCADGSVATEWIDALNRECGEERFGFCLNVGTCSICGQNMQEFATHLGNRMKSVIVRDCDGNQEGSMLPFTSVYQRRTNTDWLGLIRGLRNIGFAGNLILDIADTAAAFSPILRPQLLQMAYAVAKYFKWQIEIESRIGKYKSIVLFGAGNMCRNYMKCYGSKYPPLFTCDNNAKLWGTEFEGLIVKNPKELENLPEDCAIFICNMYYDEIKEQLRSMGIKNPIEYFSDEYMPSFYFDRLNVEKRDHA